MTTVSENERYKVDKYLAMMQNGDSSAMEALYEATAKPLYTLCYTYMRNHHDSEDALSETYLSVVRNIEKYRGRNGFNWLYTIAKNICLNMIRKNGRTVAVDYNDEEALSVLGLSGNETIHLEDESGIIELSEKVLNENEFRIVILHAVNDMKFKDIARIVAGLESTVRWQYNNAIKKVKNAYERRQTNDRARA
jgi:RNA polymerase sigma-70 factor (ECF subfamily)